MPLISVIPVVAGRRLDPIMRRHLQLSAPGSRMLLLVLLAASFAIPPLGTAQAQARSVVSGLVTDPLGVPLFGAAVSVTGTRLTASTDERGEFRLAGVTPGHVEIRARRLGFTPEATQIHVVVDQNVPRVHLSLTPLPTALTPVVVSTSRRASGRLGGYYERLQRRSSGQFISRELIDRREHRSLSQLISEAPGIRSYRLTGAGGGVVRMRGRSCRPLVWLDGVPMPAGEVDLDAFPVSTIHGIELYLGGTNAPPQFTAMQGRSNCGTILIWSRGQDTDPPAVRRRNRAVDLERMVASLSIYTADQVDTPVRPDSTVQIDPVYPPELFALGVGGSVVVEFVVDAGGRIEADTYGVVASSHHLFSAAVMRALAGARFLPAMKDGNPVRQLVQQPFGFTPPAR